MHLPSHIDNSVFKDKHSIQKSAQHYSYVSFEKTAIAACLLSKGLLSAVQGNKRHPLPVFIKERHARPCFLFFNKGFLEAENKAHIRLAVERILYFKNKGLML
jgi:hypothetical protein